MSLRALGVLAAAILVAPWLLPPFYVTLADYVGLAAIVVLGLVLLGGAGGLMSFGQASFVGIGAYTTGYLTLTYGLSPWIALLVGLFLTGIVAFLLGALTLKLTGHYLPIGTLAWSISLFYVFSNVDALGAHDGLANLPPLHAFGWELQSKEAFFYLIWIAVAASMVSIGNILDSRFGRAVRSGGRATPMAEAVGVDTWRVSMAIFIYAALLAALSGWLVAHFLRFVNPTPFGLSASIEYFFMTVIGGATSIWGAIVGSAIYIIGKQWLQTAIPALTGRVGQFDIIVFGVIIIGILHFARQGIVPLIFPVHRRKRRAVSLEGVARLERRPQPAAGSELLYINGARKTFGGLIAVNDVSFDVRAGDIVALIGPNGAGKTTMFNLITGVLPRTSGSISFCGASLDGLSSRQVMRRGISRTFQHALLRPHMTVLENVALGAHTRGRSGIVRAALRLERAEERQLLAEAQHQLERVGLENLADASADSLALGQQRIVEIARALASDPLLLLLDEPAAGLRYEEKVALAKLLVSLRAEGMTLLLVEHDMDFVMNLVDRLVVMDFGEQIAQGKPEEIQNNPRVIEAYLGGAEGMLALEARGVSFAYGKAQALRDINVEVKAGSIVSLIGPNGAGKTTMLLALMGLLRPSGEVLYYGDDIAAVDVEGRVGRGLCLVPERRELFGDMTVRDNLALGGFSQWLGGQRDFQAQTDAVLQRFPRLKERWLSKAQTLSGGERQMLALGRALMAKPKLLMLDEPSLGLAPIMVREIFRIIADLRTAGVSILLVEQNARAALEIADYAYVLENGAISLHGAANDLAGNARIVDTYLGRRTA